MRSPPTGIGHAGQRHHLLDDLEPLQILEAVGDLAVHHAVDLQLPVVAAHLRHAQRGVDPVEVVVAGDERRQRNAFRLHRRRHRLRRATSAAATRTRRGHRLTDDLSPRQHDADHAGERARAEQAQRHQ